MQHGRAWWVGAMIVVSILLAFVQLNVPGTGTAASQSPIVPANVEGALPVADPDSATWSKSTPLDVPMSAQMAVKPNRSTPFVPSIKVQVLKNSSHIALLVKWADTTKDNHTTKDTQFRDAVAVQFGPAGSLPNICMGAKGQRLSIMQWKADWQADIEGGFWDLQDEYPNFWVDVYPYAVGAPPYRVPDSFKDTAREYLVGWKVGNPFSQPAKVTAVEDAVAEGFGTIATQDRQDSIGRGVHTGSEWKVVVARALDTGDGEDVKVADGISVAFAVWDGSSRDVGARKSVSSWNTLEIKGGAPAGIDNSQVAAGMIGGAMGIGLAIGLIIASRRMQDLQASAKRRYEREEAAGQEEKEEKADEDEAVETPGREEGPKARAKKPAKPGGK